MKLSKFIALFLLSTFLTGSLCIAQENAAEKYNWDLAGTIAVQSGGRVKPLDTYARELIAQVYGKSNYKNQHPVETYFHWMSDGDKWAEEKIITVAKGDLHKRLQLEESRKFFSLVELQSNDNLRLLAREAFDADQAGKKLSFTQAKGNELLNRTGVLQSVFSHESPLYCPPLNGDPETTWLTMPDVMQRINDSTTVENVSDPQQLLALAFAGLYNSVRDNRPDVFNAAAEVFIRTQHQMLEVYPKTMSTLNWEYTYHRLNPFFWARLLLVFAAIFYLTSYKASLQKLKSLGLASLIFGFLFFTTGMAMRAYISGRAPWSNMYESLLAIGWTLVLIALIYELIKREKYFGVVAGILGALILGIAGYATLDRGINPLVPALQSYWLNYHVIITLSSYACFAIAMGLGHGVLVSAIRNNGKFVAMTNKLADANLKIIQLGTLLLITGILLGAVWANSSWGRFWGWDPKETWALITWFVYIAFLHGKSAGWLNQKGLAVVSVAAFPVVVMTYYGVNYYLSGLHSYGAGSAPGIPWQVFAYLGGEGLFLFWAVNKLRGQEPTPPSQTPKQPSVKQDEPVAA